MAGDELAHELLGTRDATAWAKRFAEVMFDLHGLDFDESNLVPWFANAIETGVTYGMAHVVHGAVTLEAQRDAALDGWRASEGGRSVERNDAYRALLELGVEL